MAVIHTFNCNQITDLICAEFVKIGADSDKDEELEARSPGEAVRWSQWSGHGLSSTADERLCLPDGAGRCPSEQSCEVGVRGLAQNASEAAESKTDQAHRRDGVDVRLSGQHPWLQQVEPADVGYEAEYSRKLMELNTNSENMLRVKPLGELTKKKKKKKANTIIPIEIPAPMYGKQKNRK